MLVAGAVAAEVGAMAVAAEVGAMAGAAEVGAGAHAVAADVGPCTVEQAEKAKAVHGGASGKGKGKGKASGSGQSGGRGLRQSGPPDEAGLRPPVIAGDEADRHEEDQDEEDQDEADQDDDAFQEGSGQRRVSGQVRGGGRGRGSGVSGQVSGQVRGRGQGRGSGQGRGRGQRGPGHAATSAEGRSKTDKRGWKPGYIFPKPQPRWADKEACFRCIYNTRECDHARDSCESCTTEGWECVYPPAALPFSDTLDQQPVVAEERGMLHQSCWQCSWAKVACSL